MSKNESGKCHFSHFIVALGFMLSQAYSITKGFFKSLKTSPTTHPCQDQPHHFVVIDIPTDLLPPSSGYITTQEYQDQPHYGLDTPTNNLPPSSSATQDHHDQPQPQYIPNTASDRPPSSTTQDHRDQPRPHYVLDAASSTTQDHHDQPQPYYDHHDQPRPHYVLDASSSATQDHHDQPRPRYVLDAPSSPTQDHHDQPRPHDVLHASSSTTQDHHDQPQPYYDHHDQPRPHYVLDAPSSATQDHHDQPGPYYDHHDQPRPYYVIDAPAGSPPSSVSGSIQPESNHIVHASPNATNNPIWQQIVVQNLGAAVLAVAAAVFSQNKDNTGLKDGWVAVTLLFGVAAIWNGLLFRGKYTKIASKMEIIGMALVFLALSGLARSFFTPQNKHWIMPWLFFAFMCLPIVGSMMTDFLKM